MPIDRNALAALIDRVERGETGRELDADVWLACAPGRTRVKWSYVHTATGKLCEVDETRQRQQDGTNRLIVVPCYTTSIDAQAALPGDICEIHGYLSDKNEWTTWRARVLSIAGVPVWGVGPTECAARLATKLRAIMEAQDE